jgi:hypothetical protein
MAGNVDVSNHVLLVVAWTVYLHEDRFRIQLITLMRIRIRIQMRI